MLCPNLQRCVRNIVKACNHLLVLFVNEAGHLLEALLVVGLRTEIYDVGSQTGHASLTVSTLEMVTVLKNDLRNIVRGAGALLSLSVKGVEGADGVVKQRSINLPLQLGWEPGRKLHSRSLTTKNHLVDFWLNIKTFQTWEKSRWTKTFLQFA